MRITYLRFRIMLFAIALGLSSVWMWKWFEIGRESVTVDLPVVRSADVFPVFGIEQRWMDIGGGSGPHGLHVGFHIESEKKETVTLRLSNYLEEKSIFLFVASDNQLASPSVSYFLECLTPGSLQSVVTWHRFGVGTLRLDPGQDFKLDVPKPKIKGRCWVRVPYDYDPAGSSLLDDFNPTNWKEFDQKANFYVSSMFFNR